LRTRHAWRNRSAQNCIAAFVCIGAKRSPTVDTIVKDHLAAFNSHDVERMASFWMEDIVLDDIGVGVIRGKQELQRYASDIFTAIPDVKKELKSFFCTGDQAVCEILETGTQTGALGGYLLPAKVTPESVPGYSRFTAAKLADSHPIMMHSGI